MGIRDRVALLRLPADLRSELALVRLALGRARGDTVTVRVRPLGGAPVHLRPGTTDLENFAEGLIARYAEPPPEAPTPLRTAVEIGTNIGVGLALIAATNPQAKVYGVEADAGNLALARRNLEPFDATLLHAAAWDADGTVELVRQDRGASGFEVREAITDGVPARTLTALLNLLLNDETTPVDYLYLDVEGAHQRVLRAADTAWAQRVRTIKVAGHAGTPYDEQECAADLERLGYRTRVIPYEPIGWTVGARTARPHTETS